MLEAVRPLQLVPAQAAAGRGVLVQDRDGTGLALVMARSGDAEAVAALVQARYGIALPRGPLRVQQGDTAFAGVGPGVWFASCERGGNRFAATLAETLRRVASVTDQSDGYALLRLGGPAAQRILSRLVPIDLHPAQFAPGAVAATVLSHVAVTLWRVEDGAAGDARYDLAFYRSFTESVWHALADATSEVGLQIVNELP